MPEHLHCIFWILLTSISLKVGKTHDGFWEKLLIIVVGLGLTNNSLCFEWVLLWNFRKRSFSLCLSSYLKKSWHIQASYLWRRPGRCKEVHVGGKWTQPRLWHIPFRLWHLRKAREGTLLLWTPEKRGRWGMANGWRSADERSHTALPGPQACGGERQEWRWTTLHNVLSLGRYTLGTLLSSFTLAILQSKCH